MTDFDDFADLNAAIAQQLTAKAETKAAAEARARLRRTPPASPEAAADRALIAGWEQRHEWRAEALFALFERETCECCGTVGERFVQWMVREAHRREAGASRTRAIPAAEANGLRLPTSPRVQRRLAPMCPDCATTLLGFDLDNAPEL